MKNLLAKINSANVYDIANKSPLDPAAKLSAYTQCNVWLKREDLQPVRSFKLRGAYNKIVNLSHSDKKRGVIAASAGNHAQGIALSAKKLGIRAVIIMPTTTPAIKIDSVKNYGAKVFLKGDNYSEAYEYCQKIIKESGMCLIHPFDDLEVIAGQGTIGKEVLDQLPNVDYIFVPVGGGGLLAGIATYVKQLSPNVKVIGVEPEDSAAMHESLKKNKRIILGHVGIFADGVAVKQVGKETFKLTKKYADEVITVTTDEVCAAIKAGFEDTRSILEPAGALGIAGAVKYSTTNHVITKNLVAICSGANMTFERLQFIAERTLTGSNREALFAIQLKEKAGALRQFCERAVKGHSITEFSYRLHSRQTAFIFVGINVVNSDDKNQFMSKLKRLGYAFSDLSFDELSKEHVRYMIGGHSNKTKNEVLYHINFPERPGALNDFLVKIGNKWNISLFHYRGLGGDVGRVLIGFELLSEKNINLESSLRSTSYDFVPISSAAANIFLS